MQSQLIEYLDMHCLHSAEQHGYRKLHSTETALSGLSDIITVINDRVLQAMDNGEISILVLLDLSKCFDVVSHPKLLEKLQLHGVFFSSHDNFIYTNTITSHYTLTGGAGGGRRRPPTDSTQPPLPPPPPSWAQSDLCRRRALKP